MPDSTVSSIIPHTPNLAQRNQAPHPAKQLCPLLGLCIFTSLLFTLLLCFGVRLATLWKLIKQTFQVQNVLKKKKALVIKTANCGLREFSNIPGESNEWSDKKTNDFLEKFAYLPHLDYAILSVEGMILFYGSTPATSDGLSWLSENAPVCTLQPLQFTALLYYYHWTLHIGVTLCILFPEESEDIICPETQGFWFKRTSDPTYGVSPLSLMKWGTWTTEKHRGSPWKYPSSWDISQGYSLTQRLVWENQEAAFSIPPLNISSWRDCWRNAFGGDVLFVRGLLKPAPNGCTTQPPPRATELPRVPVTSCSSQAPSACRTREGQLVSNQPGVLSFHQIKSAPALKEAVVWAPKWAVALTQLPLPSTELEVAV